MRLRKLSFLLSMIGMCLLTGCETGRNYQGDIDSLNSRVSSLQNQLTAKDEEIARLRSLENQIASKDKENATLQSQLGDERQTIGRLEDERKALSEKLNAALAKASKKEIAARDLSDIK